MTRQEPASLSISLPKSLRQLVKRRVHQGGFGNVSEYIRALIRADEDAGARSPGGRLPGIAAGRSMVREAALRAHEGASAADEGLAGSAAAVDFGAVDFGAVDFGSRGWRELREALLAGEVRVMQRRLAEAAELFHAALSVRRGMLRQERPRAAEADLEAALASWLRDQGAGVEDPALRPAPERMARFQRG